MKSGREKEAAIHSKHTSLAVVRYTCMVVWAVMEFGFGREHDER